MNGNETPEEVERWELWQRVGMMPDAEFQARVMNLRVRMQNHHSTSHIDVLVLMRLLDEAHTAAEDAAERHRLEFMRLNDVLSERIMGEDW